jgi:4-azaleucine resistance transporter AzlC
MESSTGKIPARRESSRIRDGIRVALPLAIPTLLLGVAFGVLAKPVMGSLPPVVMSVLVFSGAAQFAALSILAAGGAALSAIAAGLLMNSRWLAMGFAVGPSLPGGRLARAARGQAIVDASFALSSRGDGSFDPGLLVGATVPQVMSWIAGTVVGVLAGSSIGDPEAIGLNAVFPAFYLALLAGELERHEAGRQRRLARLGAVGGAAITISLMPLAPTGVPVIAAAAVALIGLRQP